ncbi:uncharacterized protein At2g29880-like [Jatropha curcas]|uniref:uncharacterized protein At2g29880-like n=1 Tax=Jatropha curcas TaxID=180498 RepID=UPI0009D6BA62|nr:uncharacterized protein At2g29880-like [Jatropha curcas]
MHKEGKNAYSTWSFQESKLLLDLIVDSANHGRRDSNGVFSRLIVTTKILPKLNEALEFCQSHPNHKYLHTDSFSDIEDLKIAIGDRTAVRKYSLGLGGDDTDARSYRQKENTHVNIEDLLYDENNEAYMQTKSDSSY